MLVVARNMSVGIEDGVIVAAEGAFDLVIEIPDGDVCPGLINAHDHLHRNHYGRLGTPPYRSAYQWAGDIQARYRAQIAQGRARPRREMLLAGAWKNLFCGVTSVVHHDRWEAEFDQDFPIRVVPLRNVDSLGLGPARELVGGEGPFALHVAEGIDAGAAGEVGRLDAMGLLRRDLIAVHGVGMDAGAITRFRASGAALVWCPSSNLFLFGRTVPPSLLAHGIDVLLGSDSLLTGAGDLLDELRLARSLELLDDARLEAAVGVTAAHRLGIEAPSLEPGAPADLVVIVRPLLEARAQDVSLVVVGGEPRVARPDLVPQLGRLAADGREMRLGTVTRWTAGRGGRSGRASPPPPRFASTIEQGIR
jgi:cytosine/adenosine deaminase-related metal-dependent hydrolase